jgi:hypothetical protein
MPPANPSMTTETRQRLLDALASCHAIGRYTARLDLAGYERDDMVRDAVERRAGVGRATPGAAPDRRFAQLRNPILRSSPAGGFRDDAVGISERWWELG